MLWVLCPLSMSVVCQSKRKRASNPTVYEAIAGGTGRHDVTPPHGNAVVGVVQVAVGKPVGLGFWVGGVTP